MLWSIFIMLPSLHHRHVSYVPELLDLHNGLPAVRPARRILNEMAIFGATYMAFLNLYSKGEDSRGADLVSAGLKSKEGYLLTPDGTLFMALCQFPKDTARTR